MAEVEKAGAQFPVSLPAGLTDSSKNAATGAAGSVIVGTLRRFVHPCQQSSTLESVTTFAFGGTPGFFP
jgi:hypothetical protein